MENFLGKWIEIDNVKGVKQGLEKRSDIDHEEKGRLKDSKSTYEFSKNGGNYSVKFASTAYPGMEKTVSFSLGVPFGGQTLDGKNFKATIRLDGSVMVEEGNHDKWGDYKAIRKVKDDSMLITVEMDGSTFTQNMKKM